MQAIADVAPQVRQAMAQHPVFANVGQWMLLAWAEGVQGLRDEQVYGMRAAELGAIFEALKKIAEAEGFENQAGPFAIAGKEVKALMLAPDL